MTPTDLPVCFEKIIDKCINRSDAKADRHVHQGQADLAGGGTVNEGEDAFILCEHMPKQDEGLYVRPPLELPQDRSGWLRNITNRAAAELASSQTLKGASHARDLRPSIDTSRH